MSQFVEFVESQVKSSEKLRDRILAAVFDDEVPMSSVDDDLEAADVRVVGYDRVQHIVTTQLRVPWTGTLAIDDEGEMTESGVVTGTVRFKHRGRALELVGVHLEVAYDTLFTAGEEG
jgi:hypothetical protein